MMSGAPAAAATVLVKQVCGRIVLIGRVGPGGRAGRAGPRTALALTPQRPMERFWNSFSSLLEDASPIRRSWARQAAGPRRVCGGRRGDGAGRIHSLSLIFMDGLVVVFGGRAAATT